ncbi:MAG: TonB-dependent receptor, partial [Caulobacterales bacterium]|nr:TonB-dependent receptor [Caulobacterales bacterium]
MKTSAFGALVRASLLSTAAMAPVLALSGTVMAQQPAEPEAEEGVEALIITGTRIRRTEFDLPVPAQVLSREQLNLAGANELSEAILELPAISPAITTETSQSSTQSSGSSTISLRGLGSTRTLTLIDGRRTVGNTSTGSTISLSTIPDGFVERVEVITGGASALYGSDAVTGVVNVIMRDDLDGVELEGRYGTSQEGGNTEYGFDFTAGSNLAGERGNVMFAFGYDKEEAILESERDKAMINLELDENTNDQPDELVPNNSTSIPGGLFAGNSGTIDDPSRDTTFWFFDDGGVGALTSDFDTDVDGFDALGPETISIPRERFLLASKFDLDLTEYMEFFVSAQYSNVRTKSERAADTANSGRLAADFPIFLSDGVTPHPFVPQEIFDDAVELGRTDVFFRRRWSEFGNRFRESDNDTLRAWAGVRGEFWDSWSYEASFGYGEWRRAQSRVGDLVIPNYQAAIDVEFIDPANPDAGLQCANEFARDAGCVPLNPFGLGSVTEEQVNWLILRDQLRARNRTTTGSAWATGDLMDLWAGPVAVAFGYDYRKEESQTRWDPISTSGGGTVTQQVNQDGKQDVHEVFGEMIVPLLRDAPFAHSLSVEGAVRLSDYSTVGSVTSFKAGGSWAPIEDVRFRGVFARANRAPNNLELFSRGIGSQGALDGD